MDNGHHHVSHDVPTSLPTSGLRTPLPRQLCVLQACLGAGEGPLEGGEGLEVTAPPQRVCEVGNYRGASLIRNPPLLGPYSRTIPRVLWWSQGGGLFLMSEVPL